MATFVQIIPTEDATKKMIGLRIDQDFRLTYRITEGGTTTNYRVNFSGLLTDQTFQGSPPIGLVRTIKVGTTEQAVIEVLAYHAPGEESEVPAEGIYWYSIKDHYPFDGPVEGGKTRAPDPAFTSTAQDFGTSGITIFNDPLVTPAWPTTANLETSKITQTTLYGQLGTVEARRQYLKQLILKNVDHPLLPMWLSGGHITAANNQNTEKLLEHVQRLQIIPYWLEMLTGAISVNSNLMELEKFNLLEGVCKLSAGPISSNSEATLAFDIYGGATGNGNRSNFVFQRIGNVGAAPEYQYSRTNTDWTRHADNRIAMTNSETIIGEDWITWLRS